jgi:hypothetical protein
MNIEGKLVSDPKPGDQIGIMTEGLSTSLGSFEMCHLDKQDDRRSEEGKAYQLSNGNSHYRM